MAVVVRKPELALPLAFLSHFALDLVPHYNPDFVTKKTFKGYDSAYSKKLGSRAFMTIFVVDMALFVTVLISSLFVGFNDVSRWTVFFSALLAASPDFEGGFYFACRLVGIRLKQPDHISRFARFHIVLQWMERPWGLFVECGWFAGALALILLIGR